MTTGATQYVSKYNGDILRWTICIVTCTRQIVYQDVRYVSMSSASSITHLCHRVDVSIAIDIARHLSVCYQFSTLLCIHLLFPPSFDPILVGVQIACICFASTSWAVWRCFQWACRHQIPPHVVVHNSSASSDIRESLTFCICFVSFCSLPGKSMCIGSTETSGHYYARVTSCSV